MFTKYHSVLFLLFFPSHFLSFSSSYCNFCWFSTISNFWKFFSKWFGPVPQLFTKEILFNLVVTRFIVRIDFVNFYEIWNFIAGWRFLYLFHRKVLRLTGVFTSRNLHIWCCQCCTNWVRLGGGGEWGPGSPPKFKKGQFEREAKEALIEASHQVFQPIDVFIASSYITFLSTGWTASYTSIKIKPCMKSLNPTVHLLYTRNVNRIRWWKCKHKHLLLVALWPVGGPKRYIWPQAQR